MGEWVSYGEDVSVCVCVSDRDVSHDTLDAPGNITSARYAVFFIIDVVRVAVHTHIHIYTILT